MPIPARHPDPAPELRLLLRPGSPAGRLLRVLPDRAARSLAPMAHECSLTHRAARDAAETLERAGLVLARRTNRDGSLHIVLALTAPGCGARAALTREPGA